MKINENGEYLPFAGVTLIALTNPADAAIWQQLYDFLTSQPEILAHFTPTPPTAYHTTLNPLYTQRQTSDLEWLQFMDKNQPRFKALHQFINSEHFALSSNMTVNTDDLRCEHALQLIIQLPSTDHQNIKNIDKNVDIREWSPEAFHMTLGYRYKTMTPETKAMIKDIVLNKIKTLFSDAALTLAPPSLCYFSNMTQFTPWDGATNPFLPLANEPLSTPLREEERQSALERISSLPTSQSFFVSPADNKKGSSSTSNLHEPVLMEKDESTGTSPSY